ncbi:peptide-methionine (R)-S-oxide reductase [Pontibacter ummariensis]|uniref:peptide-methionine (R)-S-oxide reductase n=1 Tax=Pontibacter ummariensis TaxID=1610492 RepID=A0A239CJF2_9BACT|nr:peptide-methionine (R)-S-oxide reductase [Pontibacter ummariensis]PRY14980.1 peptide-methionine (R)-S-oxide reductase [Pontibacter ummariensis]SNS20240.1 peptide-methionine (R)-S-oxide reductase [Pontibacter ummariensis]
MVRNQKIDPSKQEQQEGFYVCSRCGTTLFEASKKFEVGSGFPSFWSQVGENVQHNPLDTYGRDRIQLLCNHCKQHLGHLFDDARTPTHVRYCINADAIKAEAGT